MIQIHPAGKSIEFEDVDPSGFRADFMRTLTSVDSRSLVANVDTTYFVVQLDRFYLPSTVNDKEYNNSYVCSPYNGMIQYPLDELTHIDSLATRIGIRTLVYGLSPWLKLMKINRVVTINNAMLSTNLYPRWSGVGLIELTKELVSQFPRHAIMFRSLNFATTPELCQTFESSDYLFVPSRLLYVIDPSDDSILEKRNLRFDYQLLEETPYEIVRHSEFTDEDDGQIKSLYDQLYLKKYSYHNPQFTAEYIRLFRKTNQIEFIGLRNGQGKLVGVIGTLTLNNQFTTPIVGYDFSVPIEHGLYRLLTALVIKKSFSENRIFNMSSGVGKFKKHRGAVPNLEYSAVYTKHLPRRQRAIWSSMGWLMKNVAAPMVQKNEL